MVKKNYYKVTDEDAAVVMSCASVKEIADFFKLSASYIGRCASERRLVRGRYCLNPVCDIKFAEEWQRATSVFKKNQSKSE